MKGPTHLKILAGLRYSKGPKQGSLGVVQMQVPHKRLILGVRFLHVPFMLRCGALGFTNKNKLSCNLAILQLNFTIIILPQVQSPGNSALQSWACIFGLLIMLSLVYNFWPLDRHYCTFKCYFNNRGRWQVRYKRAKTWPLCCLECPPQTHNFLSSVLCFLNLYCIQGLGFSIQLKDT